MTGAGADPGFFLGGGALVSCSTSTPINHIVFFFFLQNTSCIRKPQVISGVRGGGGVRTPCTLPLDPPLWRGVVSGSCFHFDVRIRPSVPGYISPAMTTISSTSTFRLSVCHAFLDTSAGSASLLQRCQKESTIFCTNSTRRRGCFVSLNGL